MGLAKYGTILSGRSSLLFNYLTFKDLAILEHGTQGHMIFNFGQHFNQTLKTRLNGVYNTAMGEMDLVLGVDDKIYEASEEVKNDGYKHLFLLPSAIGDVMAFDLEFYAQDLSANLGIDVFTTKINSDYDYYQGEEVFFNSLKRFIVKDDVLQVDQVSIIGDLNTYENVKKHQNLRRFLRKYLGVETLFDSLKDNELQDCNKLISSSLIICTSQSALKLAEDLKNEYGIPYYYFNSIDLVSLKEDLEALSKILNVEIKKELENDVFNQISFEFSNVLDFNKETQLVFYLDIDKLEATKKFISHLNVSNQITYLCKHVNESYETMGYDQVIDRYQSPNYLVISDDLIHSFIKDSVVIERSGQEYHLLTPNIIPYSLLEGGYNLMEKIVEALIKE